MAVIHAQAYADDSGKEPPVYVFAGFVSSSAAWALFSDEWQDVLDNARPRKISYIKMRDAYALQNQFLGFSETERDDLLCSLWEIINKHAEYGVSVTIDANRYSVAFKKRIARTLDSPYFILNDHFVRGVIQAELERSMTRTVDFIFDEQGHEWKDVEIFWKLRQLGAPHWMKRRIGAHPIWRKEQQFKPLQAADMLAWKIRRAAVEMRSSIPEISIPIHSPLVEIEMIGQGLVNLKTVRGTPYETGRMRSNRRNPRAKLFRP